MQPAISRILVPLDFSAHGDHVLRYAMVLAEQLGATLDLLHVVEDPVATLAWSSAIDVRDLPDLRNTLVDDASRQLQHCRDVVVGPSVRVTSAVRVGLPMDAITEYAREAEADLIVMGSRGQGGAAEVLMGSVAAWVARHAPCPVLTLHPRMPAPVHPLPPPPQTVILRCALGRLGTSRE